MLDAESVILVYYGAADSVICVAQARVGDLIPIQYGESDAADNYRTRG